MKLITSFCDAAGKPINGTIVVEGSDGAIQEADVIDGTVDGYLEPGEYVVAISASGKTVFGPHEMTAREGKLVRKERT